MRPFDPAERIARDLDERDPLAPLRARFHIPTDPDKRSVAYFSGHSLGLQPIAAADYVRAELDDWARLGVDAHFEGRFPWYSYHESFREPLSRLAGAHPAEVVAMNGLTVNLHLMMVSFYRPTAERHAVLIEDKTFPSDRYAVLSQLRWHGFDPETALIIAKPREGEHLLRTDDVEALIERHGRSIALVLLPGVQYFTGQRLDLRRLAAAARRQGCTFGADLAHAIGNVPLRLHDWNVDFAVWCSYKYLNGGPGAVAGCFVHERHVTRADLPRLAGWWGNDPETRFRMHLEREFVPRPSADGWQLSNPPILALAPLRASLAIFDEAGMDALRAKSELLTRYLVGWVRHASDGRLEILTPDAGEERGCQISLRAKVQSAELFRTLRRSGIVGDFREPDVVRIAPVPAYNSFRDVWRMGRALAAWAVAT
jgi:kynureninase